MDSGTRLVRRTQSGGSRIRIETKIRPIWRARRRICPSPSTRRHKRWAGKDDTAGRIEEMHRQRVDIERHLGTDLGGEMARQARGDLERLGEPDLAHDDI